jgi:hypothetical protein
MLKKNETFDVHEERKEAEEEPLTWFEEKMFVSKIELGQELQDIIEEAEELIDDEE